MAQSTWIALAIVSLFLVYVTARGELAQYLATILGPYPGPETGGPSGVGASGQTTVSSVTGQVRQVADLATQTGSLVQRVSGSDLFGGGGSGGPIDFGGGADFA